MNEYDEIFARIMGGAINHENGADGQGSRAKKKPDPVDPREAAKMAADGMGFGRRALAGVGSGIADLSRGVRQVFTQDPQKLAALKEQEAESRAYKSGLGGAGTIGNIGSKALLGAGSLFIPGANTVTGAAITGGLLAGAEPIVDGESRLQNAAIGASLGGGLQKGLGIWANASKARVAAETAKQANNAQRDAVMQKLIKEGYTVPSTWLNNSATNRALESLGGKDAIKQTAQLRNLEVTQNLARKAVGLPDLTPDTLKAAREAAGKNAYAPIDALPNVQWTPEFVRNMDNIANNIGGRNQSVSILKNPEAIQLAEELGAKTQFKGTEVNGLIKALREQGNQAAYTTYGQAPAARTVGKAQLASANALEDLVDQNAPGLIGQLREGRKQIAKLHDVENAMNPATGEVTAKYFGRKLAKNKPLDGDLKTIGEFANTFPTLAVDTAGRVPTPGVSALNPISTVAASGVGGAKAGILMELANMARAPARSLALSPKYQSIMAQPKYHTTRSILENDLLRRSLVGTTPIGLLELLE